jgi:hypothetical protein
MKHSLFRKDLYRSLHLVSILGSGGSDPNCKQKLPLWRRRAHDGRRQRGTACPLLYRYRLTHTYCSLARLPPLYVGGGLQPGAALVVVYLAVVTLPPRSTAPTVAGCRLVGCSVVRGRPLRSRAVAGVSLQVYVCLGPVLASHATSPPAAAAAAWRGRGRVHIAGWSYGGGGPVRGLRGGGRMGWCEEWARRGYHHPTSSYH